jgi:ubiquinone biosynthesis accessory factor UbiJ
VTGGFSIKSRTLPALDCGGFKRPRAYNPCMLHSLNLLLGQAVVERLTLLVNHVLSSEPVATQRMRAHAGCVIGLQFEGWPALLPPLPATAFRVTKAGLLEWCGAEVPTEPDLRVSIDASNPALAMAQALGGTRPQVDVAGDAAFATDLNWLFDNLRWDVQDDLARIVGQAPAREIARVAGGIAAGMREAAKAVSGLVARR